MQNIFFHSLDISFQVFNKKKIKFVIDSLFKNEGKTLDSLNYIFCSDEFLLKLNQSYLSHNFYTDVITFDLSENPKLITSDIYISIERVKENAKTLSLKYRVELLRVMIHGLLHLCGYKDKNTKDIFKMRELENFYIEIYKTTL